LRSYSQVLQRRGGDTRLGASCMAASWPRTSPTLRWPSSSRCGQMERRRCCHGRRSKRPL